MACWSPIVPDVSCWCRLIGCHVGQPCIHLHPHPLELQTLDELQRDAFPAVAASRPARALGTAVQVAAAMMGGCLPAGSGAARLILLVGGACTEGGGKVVDKELSEPLR